MPTTDSQKTPKKQSAAKRWLWFLALYLGGVAAVAALGFSFKILFQWWVGA
ncbi:hypothetical protein GP5015_2031 [gamma proteobacterium HTCC5015]|nr:hypothetical protein GP5015_2031 [gamma proteobacterium HTCC5015]